MHRNNITMPAIKNETFPQETFVFLAVEPLRRLDPCEIKPGALAASSLASSLTATPNLPNERIIALTA